MSSTGAGQRIDAATTTTARAFAVLHLIDDNDDSRRARQSEVAVDRYNAWDGFADRIMSSGYCRLSFTSCETS